MSLTQEEIERFPRKLYRFLEEGHRLEFRKMRMYSGEIAYDEKDGVYVTLDHRKDVISTLIHEALHYFYPDKSEMWILRMERRVINQLSERQVRNIIRCLAKNL